ncbi:hypothetical protein CRYUN_Cryun04dG0174500 [Craigia yunnanensis]
MRRRFLIPSAAGPSPTRPPALGQGGRWDRARGSEEPMQIGFKVAHIAISLENLTVKVKLQVKRIEFDVSIAGSSVLHLVLKWTLWEHLTEELWAMKLGLKLLQERAKVGSFWWPYTCSLPETYSVSIFFAGEDIKNLQYAPLLYQLALKLIVIFCPNQVNKRCCLLLEFVKRALKKASSEVNCDFLPQPDASSLGWAMSAVSSRAFHLYGKKLPDGTHCDIPMMLPLIDMRNHSFNPNARILQEEYARNRKMLRKAAEREIKHNDPVLLNYDCLTNDFFLLDYGFVIPSNPDYTELKYGALMDAASMAAGVSLPNFSSPAPWQQQIFSQLKLDGEAPNLKVIIGGPKLVEGCLLAALRVLLSNDMESVQRYDLNVLKSLSAEAPGAANKVAAFRTVIALCVIALGHFSTKITDDESLLKPGVSVSTEFVIQFWIQKKSVIIDVMRDLTNRVKLLLLKDTANA